MLQLYSIFDKKGVMYEKPFFVKHVAEATRAVQSAFNLPKEQQPWYCAYPGDYALYLVASFSQDTGVITVPAEQMPQFTIEIASLAPQVPDVKGGAK